MAFPASVAPTTTSRYGGVQRCLLAQSSIEAGETVWWGDPHSDPPMQHFSRDEILGAPPEVRAALIRCSYQIDDDVFGSTPDPDGNPNYWFNHSCDPVCGYDTDDRLVALRAITPGEEITYDYAFTETEASLHAGMQCRCGSGACRGVLQFGEWRSRRFVTQYRGHLSSYLARKVEECGWYDPRIIVKRLDGRRCGLFTLTALPKGTVCAVFAGKVVEFEHFLECDEELSRYALQVTDRLWQVPRPHFDRFETTDQINHSCDSSCGMLDSSTIITRRDLDAGDEITIDYGTVNSGMDGLLTPDIFAACKCGTSVCRGVVRNTDWMLPDVQQRYDGLFPPFLRRRIALQLLRSPRP